MSIQLVLYALSTAVAVWWAGAQWWQPGVVLALASLSLGLVAAVVARRALPAPALQLGWDGGTWRLCAPGSDSQSGQVALMLDLGRWMLVRFTPDAAGRQGGFGATWLPLSRSDAVAAWPVLRVALHAPQPARPAA